MFAAALRRTAAPQGEKPRRAEETVEPVVIKMDAEAMTNEARGDAVEHPPQDEPAARGDAHARVLVVGRSPLGQRLERGALDLDALAVASVAAPHDLVDQASVGGKLGELSRAPQQQLVLDRLLQMAVGALDRAVFMREAGIVARRRHAVMSAQLLVAPRKVVLRSAIEIAERGRQAVATVLFRYAPECPQGVLQALGERHEALTAEHHMGMLEA